MELLALELHLELLLGRRVHDVHGRIAGRLEEFTARQLDGEWVITEFHMGAAAWLERLAVAVGRLPLLSALPLGFHAVRRARWDQMVFDDPEHLRLNVAREELSLVQP